MVNPVKTVYDHQRGCGFRKPGGTYLIGGTTSSACCKLPFALTACPCCNQGIKFQRGLQWINSSMFGECRAHVSLPCVIQNQNTKMGLMWVGAKYYEKPQQFINEAAALGVSKRIGKLPADVEVNKTWIALAHPKAISDYRVAQPIGFETYCEREYFFTPGIFMLFKVTAIQYVVTGNETEEEITKLLDRGIELIEVKKVGEQTTLL